VRHGPFFAALIAALAIVGCRGGTEPDADVTLERLPLDSWAIIQPFGAWNPNWSGYHLAVDALAPAGTPVMAADAGQVLLAESGVTGYGALVLIVHELPAGSVTTLYGHLSGRRGLAVTTGDRVTAGQLIGTSADDDEDGGPWGPHLHFGVRRGAAGLGDAACGIWPYVGYSRTCAGWSHERFRDQWLDPHDVLPITFVE
jgi:murein DD-endopeptidase MepM/ murein hydrolase activator NlpD